MSRDFSTVVDDFAAEPTKTRSPGIHFDIKRFLSLRLLPVVLIASLLAIPFAVMGWMAAPDVYTATAMLQFRSSSQGILDGSTGAAGANYEKYVGTELGKLKGTIVLSRVLELPEIQKLPSIAAAKDDLAFLQSCISTSQSRTSELVTIYCTMKSRIEALTVLEKVMDVYEKQALMAISGEGTMRTSLINTEIETNSRELELLLKRIEERESTLGTMEQPDGTEAEQYLQKQLEAEDRATTAANIVADIEEVLKEIEALQGQHASNPNASIFDFDIEFKVLQDPRVASAQAELSAQESRVALLSESHKDAHPDLKAAKRTLESLRSNLAQRQQTARSDSLRTLAGKFQQDLESANRNLEDAKATELSARERYEEFVEKQQGNRELVAADRAKIQADKEKAADKREYIRGLEHQVQTIQLDEKAPARMSIAAPPRAPSAKDRKAKLILAALGVMFAMGLGAAYGVFRELTDQQIRTRQDIARISDLPTIASIPHLKEDRLLADADAAMIMANYPNSSIADEYRRILARILYPEDNAAEIGSLLIVSASTKEGKTSVATNLAIALEQANRRVLLVDLSAQKPDVEKNFGLQPGPGLSELLSDEYAREDLIRRTAFENLGVVGPGRDASKLAGRLASREMMDFMEWADEHFDHLIVDTPPLLLMSDAKLLAPAMDGVLYVVGAGGASLGMVSRCLRDLEQLRANVIGVVLSGIRNMRGGYLKKNQSLYYAYTERDEAAETVAGEMPEINVLDEDVPEPVDAEVVLLPFDDKDD